VEMMKTLCIHTRYLYVVCVLILETIYWIYIKVTTSIFHTGPPYLTPLSW